MTQQMTKASNTIDITNWSDEMLDTLLAIKAGDDVSLAQFTNKQIRLIFDAAGVASPSAAWWGSCAPQVEPDLVDDGIDYEGMILDQQDARDGDYL